MPELPEVERAAGLVRSVGQGKKIVKVDTAADEIVYVGVTHDEFAKEIQGRTLESVGRYGKLFYLNLAGDGRMPVLHFGMTGMIQVKGGPASYYVSAKNKVTDTWPPRFMKFILHLQDPKTKEVTELAFMDARRLGRIRLCASPLNEPPISTLGWDPILSMPSLEEFSDSAEKRSCPIKALLLDQSFSAGVGNWVADEVLYQASIHPEQRCNTLNESELKALHESVQHVCRTAVDANADDSKFPEHWLFKHRWGKGKNKNTMTLPDGKPATIKWITVGGRTSAYVAEVQRLPSTRATTTSRKRRSTAVKSEPLSPVRSTGKRKATKTEAQMTEEEEGERSESDLTPLEEDDEDTAKVIKAVGRIQLKRKKSSARASGLNDTGTSSKAAVRKQELREEKAARRSKRMRS